MEKNGMENAKTEEKKSWFQKTKDTFREHWKGIAVGVAAVGVLVGYIVLNTESEPELSIPAKASGDTGRSRFGRDRNEEITNGAYRGYVPEKPACRSSGIPGKERPCGTAEHSTGGE